LLEHESCLPAPVQASIHATGSRNGFAQITAVFDDVVVTR